VTDRRLRGTVLVLSALGATIAAYLTYTHVADVPVSCVTGGCRAVQTSSYAELGGVPVAALGLVAYVAVGSTALFRSDVALALGSAAALAGFVFAAYLVYVQAAILDAYCQWCLASDAVLLALVPLTLLRLRRA